MPYCPKCGKRIEVDTIYCPRCGSKIPGTERQKCECPQCEGGGKVPGSVIDGMIITWVRCPKCKGRKWIWC